MRQVITIAGLDPSLKNLGMAKGQLDMSTGDFKLTSMELIETASSKNKQVRKNSQDLERARKLHKGLTQFIVGVDMVCAEIPVGSQTARAMASYGVCVALLSTIDNLIQVSPEEVKVCTVGSKTATKQQMIDWAIKTYPYANWLTKVQKGVKSYVNKNEHLADAVATIHAGVKSSQFQQARKLGIT